MLLYMYTYTYMYMYMCMCIYIYTCICMSVYVNIFIGSLDRKLRNYRWLSWLAFPPSCQPDHHVSHLIVSTTNYQVGGKRNSSEACKFTGESTPCHENPAFFWVMWLLGSPKYNRVSVSTFPRLHLGKLSEKSAQNCHSFIRFVAGSWISWFIGSMAHWFTDSLPHWSSGWFTD